MILQIREAVDDRISVEGHKVLLNEVFGGEEWLALCEDDPRFRLAQLLEDHVDKHQMILLLKPFQNAHRGHVLQGDLQPLKVILGHFYRWAGLVAAGSRADRLALNARATFQGLDITIVQADGLVAITDDSLILVQLLVGCSSVLIKGGQVLAFVLWTDVDGLRITFDGQFVATSTEILVAFVFGRHSSGQGICRLKNEEEFEFKGPSQNMQGFKVGPGKII